MNRRILSIACAGFVICILTVARTWSSGPLLWSKAGALLGVIVAFTSMAVSVMIVDEHERQLLKEIAALRDAIQALAATVRGGYAATEVQGAPCAILPGNDKVESAADTTRASETKATHDSGLLRLGKGDILLSPCDITLPSAAAGKRS
jgi:hypothetical protein